MKVRGNYILKYSPDYKIGKKVITKELSHSAFGLLGLRLIKQIRIKICEVIGEKMSNVYLLQSISMAIKQDNTACVANMV